MPHAPRSCRSPALPRSALLLLALLSSSCSSGEPPPREGGPSSAASYAGSETVLGNPYWSYAGKTLHDYSQRPLLTMLQSGKVLLMGPTNEIYDPVADTWAGASPLPSMPWVSGILQDGRVLVPLQPNSRIYDPATDTWTPAAPPPLTIGDSTDRAVLLPSGELLLRNQKYNPATDTWTLTSPPPFALKGPAMLLATDKVLFPHGPCTTYDPVLDGNFCAGALYDPAADSWTQIAPRPPLADPNFPWDGNHASLQPYETFYATLLLNGEVLINGLQRTSSIVPPPPPNQQYDIYLGWQHYDPVADTWSLGHPPSYALMGQAQALLQDGQVLLAYGSPIPVFNSSTELYNPVTKALTAAPPPVCPFILGGPAGIRLANGKVLLVCGKSSSQAGPSLYNPGIVAGLGAPCSSAADCASGFCADGVCCNAACNAGPCDACSVAAGASADGTCTLLTGPACNDGNACTQSDTCQSGVCSGGNPVACAALDSCHDPGTCDSQSGLCSNPAKADGTPCVGGTCQAGVCQGMPDGGSGAGGASSGSGAGGASSASSGSGASSASSSSGASSASSGAGGAPVDPGADSGCVISTSPSGGSAAPGLIGLLLFALRRRRAHAAARLCP